MDIIVCVKPVINQAKIATSRDNSKLSLSNGDKTALFESLKLKKNIGAKISVISMSSLNASSVLESLYLYGVDVIYLISNTCFAGSDTFATAYVLGKMIRMLPKYDLVLMGNKSDDSETGQVPPAVACDLDVPFISNGIINYVYEQNKVIVCRKGETYSALYELTMPAVVSVASQITDFRSLSFEQLARQNKYIRIIDEVMCDKRKIGASGSKTRVVSQYDNPKTNTRDVKMIDPLSGVKMISTIIKGINNG